MAGLWNTYQTMATDPAANHTSTGGSPHEDAAALRAGDHRLGRRVLDRVELRGGDGEVAPFAPVAAEVRCPDSTGTGPDRFVAGEQLVGDVLHQLRPGGDHL